MYTVLFFWIVIAALNVIIELYRSFIWIFGFTLVFVEVPNALRTQQSFSDNYTN